MTIKVDGTARDGKWSEIDRVVGAPRSAGSRRTKNYKKEGDAG